MKLTQQQSWQALQEHCQTIKATHLKEHFRSDQNRFEKFSVSLNDFTYDYSKQRVTEDTMTALIHLANECQLREKIEQLFSGAIVNQTEHRPALHHALRDVKPTAEVSAVLAQMEKFVNAVRANDFLGVTGKPIQDIISLGIGGSDLGPLMACKALAPFSDSNIKIHFISNVDGQSLAPLLKAVDPEKTLCIINSKSFTTPETLQNAKAIKRWFLKFLPDEERVLKTHFIGVTANVEKAKAFGLSAESIFAFWEWVGGRYSIWSAVGLPIAMMIGMENFKSFLAGAHDVDTHFKTAEFTQNIPVLMGLLGIWNRNFLAYPSHAVIPYADGLSDLPAYLQQLEMESNGKQASFEQGYVTYETAPILWGGVGCNGQHAYMQLLHQGTEVVPVDFILPLLGHQSFVEQQDLLVASCLSQSQALMMGRTEADCKESSEALAQARMCPGNRPSTTMTFERLTPHNLGRLIALYEHKVFVQGVIWQIESYDQWGVELGKQLTKTLLPAISSNTVEALSLDSSTESLLKQYLSYRHTD